MKNGFSTRPALAERSSAACTNLYEHLAPVRILRKELGLTSNDLAVLTALISFVPRDRTGNPRGALPEMTVVFPSNVSLSERANGIDERTLRRCLGRLEAANLIQRKRSANGKRFPLRYGGVIKDAFGIDLAPLIQSFDTLTARASKLAEDQERLRSLKAEAMALRASLLQTERVDQAKASALEHVRTLLRRATLTVETVMQIIADLRELGANATPCYGENCRSHASTDNTPEHRTKDTNQRARSNETTSRNGQNVRHTESIKKDFNKDARRELGPDDLSKTSTPSMNRDPKKMDWEDFTNVTAFFPNAPTTGDALYRVLFDIGKLLRIRQHNLKRALHWVGSGKLLLILDFLLGKSKAIKQPEAYLETVLRNCIPREHVLDRGQEQPSLEM